VGIVRVELDGPVDQHLRLVVVLQGRAVMQHLGGEHAFVGRHVVGGLADGALLGHRLQPAGQRRNDRGRDLVLDGEDVLELAVVALRPDVPVGLGVDELDGDAHPVARLAHAALRDILHLQRLRHLLDVHRLALVDEGRVA
jgi:hypothetical protein